MPNDPLDALFEANPVTVTPTVVVPNEPAATTPQAEPQGPDRDEAGRFKAKEAAQPQAVEPVTPSPSQPVAQPQAKPNGIDPEQFKGYLDERDKRQALERRVKEFEDREAQRNQQPQQAPDFMSDPEGYTQWQQQQMALIEVGQRFSISERFAKRAYGPELVEAAKKWGDERSSDPRTGQPFARIFCSQEDPIEWIVREYKQHELMTQIGDPLKADEWIIKRAAELAAAQGQQSPQAQGLAPQTIASPQAAPLPSASLASARSAGGVQSIPIGPDAAFTAMFPK